MVKTPIVKDGYPFIGLAAAVAALLLATGHYYWSVFPVVITLFFAFFFRNPHREVMADDSLLLAPADGRIVVVEKTMDPYANREALKISVFMNVFNVHSNRVSVDGAVEKVEYFPGKFVNADLDKASVENERNAVVIRRATDGQVVTLVQVAGLVARRILCYTKVGDKLSRGQRYGFIRFGSRVDVYLPLDARPRVTIGEKVSASSTILAELDVK